MLFRKLSLWVYGICLLSGPVFGAESIKKQLELNEKQAAEVFKYQRQYSKIAQEYRVNIEKKKKELADAFKQGKSPDEIDKIYTDIIAMGMTRLDAWLDRDIGIRGALKTKKQKAKYDKINSYPIIGLIKQK